MKLILGSQSPRRADLLTKAHIDYEIRVIETDESYPATLELPKVALHIAQQKAAAHTGRLAHDEYVLTADTIVVHDNIVYGKPISEKNAYDIISTLANEVHVVYTAVCLVSNEKREGFTVKSEVKFGNISEGDIKAYIKQYQPMDKAGAYGIQDWIGYARIEWIHGSYTNILGLPMAQTYDAIKKFVG